MFVINLFSEVSYQTDIVATFSKILSLMLIGLSGCYVRGYDDGHHRDSGRHEGNERGHDEGKSDHRDEHRDR